MRKKSALIYLAVAVFAASVLAAELTINYYTKKRDTQLVDAPRSRQAVLTLPSREKLELLERDAQWLKVSSQKGVGWIYEGNVADKEPSKENENDFFPFSNDASPTSATAGARPSLETTQQYAKMKGKQASLADLEWLGQQSAAITSADVLAYLESQKKGEFQ